MLRSDVRRYLKMLIYPSVPFTGKFIFWADLQESNCRMHTKYVRRFICKNWESRWCHTVCLACHLSLSALLVFVLVNPKSLRQCPTSLQLSNAPRSLTSSRSEAFDSGRKTLSPFLSEIPDYLRQAQALLPWRKCHSSNGRRSVRLVRYRPA